MNVYTLESGKQPSLKIGQKPKGVSQVVFPAWVPNPIIKLLKIRLTRDYVL
jgi:hypothetical protein